MRNNQFPTACAIDSIAHSKLQRISKTALGALERRLHEQRLPVEEKTFLSARLATYRTAAALSLDADCDRSDCCSDQTEA